LPLKCHRGRDTLAAIGPGVDAAGLSHHWPNGRRQGRLLVMTCKASAQHPYRIVLAPNNECKGGSNAKSSPTHTCGRLRSRYRCHEGHAGRQFRQVLHCLHATEVVPIRPSPIPTQRPSARSEVQQVHRRHNATRRLWTGAEWTEGPVWLGDMQRVIFSDIPHNRLLAYDTMSGRTTVFRSPSNFANGDTRDRQGRLVTSEHGTAGHAHGV
jgi:hypothetical protein